MKIELSAKQKRIQTEIRTFVENEIAPHANRHDKREHIPPSLIRKIAENKYLASILPEENGGRGFHMVTYGILHEEVGRGCSSVRSLLTVHDMVVYAILRWGGQRQKEYWLPRLVSGESIAAFALTEPNIGSDAKNIQTTATKSGEKYIITGKKKWITYGQIADLFLLFAQCQGKPTAFLFERDTPGLTIKPIRGLLGVRASMLAELDIDNCQVPQEYLIGGLVLC